MATAAQCSLYCYNVESLDCRWTAGIQSLAFTHKPIVRCVSLAADVSARRAKSVIHVESMDEQRGTPLQNWQRATKLQVGDHHQPVSQSCQGSGLRQPGQVRLTLECGGIGGGTLGPSTPTVQLRPDSGGDRHWRRFSPAGLTPLPNHGQTPT